MIRFETVDASFVLQRKIAIKNWIKEIILTSNYRIGDINYIFTDDNYLLEVNKQYLKHDYYTDIITFDTSAYTQIEQKGQHAVSADIFISLDTVYSNAKQYGTTFTSELYRVMAHGILHLTGFDDVTPDLKIKMTAAEERALSLLSAELADFQQQYTPKQCNINSI